MSLGVQYGLQGRIPKEGDLTCWISALAGAEGVAVPPVAV